MRGAVSACRRGRQYAKGLGKLQDRLGITHERPDHFQDAAHFDAPIQCVVANRISFEACGAGDQSDRDASVVVGMKKRAPW